MFDLKVLVAFLFIVRTVNLIVIPVTSCVFPTPSAMLDASTSRAAANDVFSSMTGVRAGRNAAAVDQNFLVYVTPEKVAKSKMFLTKLQKAHASGRLKRIVIDEVKDILVVVCLSVWVCRYATM